MTLRARGRRFWAASLAFVALAAGCGGQGGQEDQAAETPAEQSPEASEVTFKTREYSFDTPSEIKGGLTSIVLDNSAGKESHEAEMIRLEEGKTLQDLQAASGPAPPSFARPAGGPGPVLAGKRATYTAVLEPGTYALVCHVPAPDGKEHLEKGMAKQIRVTQGESGQIPRGDVTIGATEFDFTGTEGLKSGNQTVRVENQGQQPHHWALVALARGKTTMDLAAFFQPPQPGAAPPQGPPPFTGFPGLVATLPPGGSAARTLELQPGTYALVCFFPDTDGTPHAAKGMLKQIEIK